VAAGQRQHNAEMDDDFHAPQHFAPMAAAFEAGIAMLAVGLGWLVGQEPLRSLRWSWPDAAWGVAAVLPPLGLFWFCVRCPWRPFARIVEVLDDSLIPLFAGLRLAEFLVIATLAGLGEEMLFRGVIQSAAFAGLSSHSAGGDMANALALVFAGVLFGLVHSITPTYVLLAGLIGVYLGGIWLATDNLLVPIVAHAGYDFLALVYLVKIRK
jgi:uncharacterized protein